MPSPDNAPAVTTVATRPGTAGAADLILRNGRIFTGDPARPQATAFAVSGGRLTAVGDEADIAALTGPGTRVVDALGRRVIPGLNDSHIHLIRGGVNYLLELRWDGVPSLSLAPADAARAGTSAHPRPVGPCGGRVERRAVRRESAAHGLRTERRRAGHPGAGAAPVPVGDPEPRGRCCPWLWQGHAGPARGADSARSRRHAHRGAAGSARCLSSSTASSDVFPSWTRIEQVSSTRHFLRELNRFGITSAIDAAGGFTAVPQQLRRRHAACPQRRPQRADRLPPAAADGRAGSCRT